MTQIDAINGQMPNSRPSWQPLLGAPGRRDLPVDAGPGARARSPETGGADAGAVGDDHDGIARIVRSEGTRPGWEAPKGGQRKDRHVGLASNSTLIEDCCARSIIGFGCLPSRCGPGVRLAGPARSPPRSGAGRVCVPEFFDTVEPDDDLPLASSPVLPSTNWRASALQIALSMLNSSAQILRCRRFTTHLAVTRARLAERRGVTCSFTAEDLHLLPTHQFAWRSQNRLSFPAQTASEPCDPARTAAVNPRDGVGPECSRAVRGPSLLRACPRGRGPTGA